MALSVRKRNRRRRERVDWRAIARHGANVLRAFGLVAVAGGGVYGLAAALDRPVRSITLEGSFQRLTPVQLEGVIRAQPLSGVLSSSLLALRSAVEQLEWVEHVSIERRWPDGLHVRVAEQVPAARWGERGLLNTRGELFVREARHVPAELPRLDGPPGTEAQVAQRYLAMREQLLGAGLDLSALALDARGAWRARLAGGVELRLGRDDADRRTARFVAMVAPLLVAHSGAVDYVDMRYDHGFAVGWRDGADAPTRVSALAPGRGTRGERR